MSDDQLLYFVEKNGTKIEVFLVNVNNSLSCFTAIKQFLKKYFVEALIVRHCCKHILFTNCQYE